MPVKLTVSFMLVAICLSTVSSVVPDAEDDLLAHDAMAEAERLRDCIVASHYSSVGDSRTVWVSVPSTCSIVIGGEGTDAHLIRVVLDDVVVSKVYLDNPLVSVTTEEVVQGERPVTFTRTAEGVVVTG